MLPETVSFDNQGHIEKKSVLKTYFLAFLFVLVSLLSFGIGRLSTSGADRELKITYDPSLSALSTPYQGNALVKTAKAPASAQTAAAATAVQTSPASSGEVAPSPRSTSAGEVVASSKGQKYHYPSCPGAKQISVANKITFKDAAAAESAGYTLALNCKVR